MHIPAGSKVEIYPTRVFRAKKKKYWWMPGIIWKWGLKRGYSWTGKWEKIK